MKNNILKEDLKKVIQYLKKKDPFLTQKFNVKKFVLISSDKAVRPTNIMGKTKRIAELIVQAYSRRNKKIKYMIVRFGNVLNSSGSVIPKFRLQIKNANPFMFLGQIVHESFY